MRTILTSWLLGLLASVALAQPESLVPMWQQLNVQQGNDYCHTILLRGDSLLLAGDRSIGPGKHRMLMWLATSGQFLDTSVTYTPDSIDASFDGFPSAHNTMIFCGTRYYDESQPFMRGFAQEVSLDGQCLWETTFSYPDTSVLQQEISAGCRTINGEYVFVGYVWILERRPRPDAITFWWVRCDSNGAIVAQDTVAIYAIDSFMGTAVTPTRDGGVIIGGTGNGGTELLLVKLDATGHHCWTQGVAQPTEGAGWGNIQRLLELNSGDLIVVGNFGPPGFGQDIFVVRTNNLGNQLWATAPNIEGDQWGRSVIPIEGNKLLVMGEAANVDSRRNVVLFTVDMQGRIHAFSHPVSSHPNNDYEVELRSVVQLPDSSFVVAGDGIFFQGTGLYHPEFYAARYGPDLSVPQPPASFDLSSPADHDTIRSQASPFVWTASSDPDPFDTVRYTLRIWNDADTLIRSALLDTSAVVAASDLLALGGTSNFHWTVSAHSSLPDTMVLSGGTREFRLESTGTNSRQATLPSTLSLSVYPNPFNPQTMITLAVPRSTRLSLKLYDVQGREVRTLCDGLMQAGVQHITVDGSALPSGVYFARLISPNFTRTQKLLLLK